ncbi:Hypothetical Protein FCC1311_109902 [Hondaea fermentalgiana]|uniref:Uncharacterized protein n=1 Tax=Hondaea fermentalgiana TaxID=2315210 RepID=A0A2R5GY87_9STRA|nr:Hypothetical Protein FCC1311_109902 [Hondaea fermentalgiana]|eukprot:GBG34768.1 Hypothetical Protein FCC1311_109902 [Hondaea fermentalgiana]
MPTTRRASRRLKAGRNNTSDAKEEKDTKSSDKDDDDDDEEEDEEEEEEDFDYVVEDEESEAYDPEEDGEKDDDGDDDDDELAANTDVINVKSDDEASVGSATPSRRTREREVTPRKPRPIRTGDHDDGEYEFDPPSGAEDAEDAEKNLRRMLTRAYHAKHRDEPETKPFNLDALKHTCSKIDIVTYEPLEKKHVVWRSETGKVAHCYNLDTLRQIALSKNKTWMEPPTFLTPMTSPMKSQILALFGEDALSLESETESTEKRLLNQVWELQVRQLGTRELHMCPICYELAVEELLADREMKRKQEKSKRKESTEVVVVDEEEDDDFEESNGEDSEDEGDDGNAKKSAESDAVNPLHVLDHYHDWDGAADMAFFSYMDVKKHLQQEHEIVVKGREEKDLVRDYRLRATDGLVQKYVSRSPKFRDEGNWAAIFWRSNRAYAGIFNMIMDKVDSREMGVRKGGTIFPRAVFQRRSRAIWDDLTGNLGTNDRAEMDAFLVDDDLSSSEDEFPSRAGRKRPRNRAVGRRRDASTADKDETTAAAEGGPSLVDEDEIEQIRILKEYYSKYDEEMGDDEDDDLQASSYERGCVSVVSFVISGFR